MNGLGDLALDLEAGQKGLEKRLARDVPLLTDGERPKWRPWMRQQPERRSGGGQLRVIPSARGRSCR
jgi:hypothetical protein